MQPLRWFDYLTLNTFWLGSALLGASMGPLIGPLLVQQFVDSSSKNTAYGDLRAVGLLVAMAVQPAFGLVSDHAGFPLGRRAPFILFGALLTALALIATGAAGDWLTLFSALIFLQVPVNISIGAAQGVIPDRVPPEQRGRASAVKALFDLLPVVLVAILIEPLVRRGDLLLALAVLAAAFTAGAAVTALSAREQSASGKFYSTIWRQLLRIILLALTFYLVMQMLRAAVLLSADIFRSVQAPPVAFAGAGIAGMAAAILLGVWLGSIIGLGRAAFRESSFIWWIVNRLFFFAAITSLQGFAFFFLQDSLELSQTEATQATAQLFVIVGISTLLAAVPSGILADRISRRSILAVAGLLAAAGTAVLITAGSVPVVYAAGVLIGLASGAFITVNWALGTSLVPPMEAGHYLGISNLAGAGAGMIGSGIGGVLADTLNSYQPGSGYRLVFAIYSALFIFSIITLAAVRSRSARLK